MATAERTLFATGRLGPSTLPLRDRITTAATAIAVAAKKSGMAGTDEKRAEAQREETMGWSQLSEILDDAGIL